MGALCSCQERESAKAEKIIMSDEPRGMCPHDDEQRVESETESSNDDAPEEMEIPNYSTHNRQRASVSAEAYGEYNTRPVYTPVVHPKSKEQEAKISALLDDLFMFTGLNAEDKHKLIDAFKVQDFPNETQIIKQGEDGKELFVVASGTAKVLRREGGDEKQVAQLSEGDVFGELALMYSAPRAATVTATSDICCFVLDRDTFNFILVEAVRQRREQYEEFLASVPLLKDLTPYERVKVADAVTEKQYKKEDVIIQQGEQGDSMYILVKGDVEAYIDDKLVKKYKPSEYFGEVALLNDQPRAATIKALSDCSVLVIPRKFMKRLLGPVEKILQRNLENYRKVLDEMKTAET